MSVTMVKQIYNGLAGMLAEKESKKAESSVKKPTKKPTRKRATGTLGDGAAQNASNALRNRQKKLNDQEAVANGKPAKY